jgi:hypothetical protein
MPTRAIHEARRALDAAQAALAQAAAARDAAQAALAAVEAERPATVDWSNPHHARWMRQRSAREADLRAAEQPLAGLAAQVQQAQAALAALEAEHAALVRDVTARVLDALAVEPGAPAWLKRLGFETKGTQGEQGQEGTAGEQRTRRNALSA